MASLFRDHGKPSFNHPWIHTLADWCHIVCLTPPKKLELAIFHLGTFMCLRVDKDNKSHESVFHIDFHFQKSNDGFFVCLFVFCLEQVHDDLLIIT